MTYALLSLAMARGAVCGRPITAETQIVFRRNTQGMADEVVTERFMRRRGIEAGTAHSLVFYLYLGVNREKAELLLDECSDRFGLKFNARMEDVPIDWPIQDGLSLILDVRLRQAVAPGTEAPSRKCPWALHQAIANDTVAGAGDIADRFPFPFREVLAQLAAKHVVSQSDRFVRSIYWIRPWITAAGKDTKTPEGTITVDHGGKTQDYRFTYDAKD